MLAGVGLGSILGGSFNWIFGFLSVLTIPKVAAAMANKDPDAAATHIGQSLWVAVIGGFCTMGLIMAFAPKLVGRALPPRLHASSRHLLSACSCLAVKQARAWRSPFCIPLGILLTPQSAV